MGKRKVEGNELVLKNTESFSTELFLLTYPLLLISGDILIPPHYLLIILAIISGIGLAFLFQRISYTIQLGILLSIFISIPLFFIGTSVAVVCIVTAFVFWRIHANFSSERHARWNFLSINTIVFTFAYLFTAIYLYQPAKSEFLHVHVQLFIFTAILSIVIRYIVIITTRRGTATIQFKEVNKMFSQLLGIATVGFLVVYYFMESAFSLMVGLVTFLFGDLFKKGASLLPDIHFQEQTNFKKSEELEETEELQLPISSDSIDLGPFITILAVIIVIIFVIVLIMNRKISIGKPLKLNYSLKTFGIRKKQQVLNDESDHLVTANAVRLAYQDFEKGAHLAKSSRLAGETVKEWFMRMEWEQDNQLIMTYDKVRYGSLTITDEESRLFVESLNKIKINNFNKNV